MKSKVEGRNYAIPEDWMDRPVRINKKETDAVLKKMNHALTDLIDVFRDAYEHNVDLYDILKESFFDFDISEGKSWRFDYAKRTCDEMIQSLSENDDDIKDELYYTTLKDLGFKQDYAVDYRWEKIIEDTDEKEIVEEVVFLKKTIYRRRTTIWEKIPYGRSSKEINYETIRLTNKMKMICENTKRIFEIKERK